MNKVWYILAFAAGAGAGVLATRTYFKKVYEDIANEEIDSVKAEYYIQKDEPSVKRPEPEPIKEPEAYVDTSSIVYEDLSKVYIPEDDHPRDDVPEYPYEITEEDYSETELSYDKLVLQYFVEDGILFDPGENEVVMGQTAPIGDDGFAKVRASDDTYALYFRNDTYGADYEVVKVAGSYYGDN